jgi:dinuclear metal center YbgI/SA1388 family protein
MKLAEVIAVFESVIPLAYQENYDNSGLIVGQPDKEITSALLCIDITEVVIDEALQLGANLIISHHPVIFNPLRKLTGSNYTERIVFSAIRNDIALYSVHTNIDNLYEGVNSKICAKLHLQNVKILSPMAGELRKLVTYVPAKYADHVRSALFAAGTGHIGKYDNCSFNLEGLGSFRASSDAKPFTGEIGKLHFEPETRIETIFLKNKQAQIINALLNSHPYEEVAYDIYLLENTYEFIGQGMIGELREPRDERTFLKYVKKTFNCRVLRHSPLLNKPFHKVAVCGGSGSFLIQKAISSGADLLITGDIKYHQYFDADGKIVIADIGHYESEQFTTEIFYEVLKKNLPNFAIHFSRINSNPINYL